MLGKCLYGWNLATSSTSLVFKQRVSTTKSFINPTCFWSSYAYKNKTDKQEKRSGGYVASILSEREVEEGSAQSHLLSPQAVLTPKKRTVGEQTLRCPSVILSPGKIRWES